MVFNGWIVVFFEPNIQVGVRNMTGGAAALLMYLNVNWSDRSGVGV